MSNIFDWLRKDRVEQSSTVILDKFMASVRDNPHEWNQLKGNGCEQIYVNERHDYEIHLSNNVSYIDMVNDELIHIPLNDDSIRAYGNKFREHFSAKREVARLKYAQTQLRL